MFDKERLVWNVTKERQKRTEKYAVYILRWCCCLWASKSRTHTYCAHNILTCSLSPRCIHGQTPLVTGQHWPGQAWNSATASWPPGPSNPDSRSVQWPEGEQSKFPLRSCCKKPSFRLFIMFTASVTSWIMSDIPSSSSSASVVAGGSKERPEPTDWRKTHRPMIHIQPEWQFEQPLMIDVLSKQH